MLDAALLVASRDEGALSSTLLDCDHAMADQLTPARRIGEGHDVAHGDDGRRDGSDQEQVAGAQRGRHAVAADDERPEPDEQRDGQCEREHAERSESKPARSRHQLFCASQLNVWVAFSPAAALLFWTVTRTL